MRCVVVPNELRDALYAKVDKALESVPFLKSSREAIYQDLLAHYDQHGVIPEFSLEAVSPGGSASS